MLKVIFTRDNIVMTLSVQFIRKDKELFTHRQSLTVTSHGL